MGVLTFRVVKKEESTVVQLKSKRGFYGKVKTYLKGKGNLQGLTNLHRQLEKLIEKEQHELKTLPTSILATPSKFNWRARKRIERFEKARAIVVEAVATSHEFSKLGHQIIHSKFLPKREHKQLKELLEEMEKFKRLLTFFAVFLAMYTKTRDSAQVFKYLKKLEKANNLKKGQIDIRWISRQWKALLKEFKEIEHHAEKLEKRLKKLADREST